MFIATEETPNPQTLMFLPGRDILPNRTLELVQGDTGVDASPLAQRLFALAGVERVFFGHDFISVSKSAEIEWEDLQPSVLASMMEHFIAGERIVNLENLTADDSQSHADSEVVRKIKELIATRVRPAVARDGGDIEFQGFDSGIAYVVLRGACAGCPSATATLKMGIENLLRHYVPEVVEVRAVS